MHSKTLLNTPILAFLTALSCSSSPKESTPRVSEPASSTEGADASFLPVDDAAVGSESATATESAPAAESMSASSLPSSSQAPTSQAPTSNPAVTSPPEAINTDDPELFDPPGWILTEPAYVDEALHVTSYTLSHEETSPGAGPTFLATIVNRGERIACSGRLLIEFFDKSQASLGSGIGSIFAKIYAHGDGSDGSIACMAPGETAIGVIANLPVDLDFEEIREAAYTLSYFDSDFIPFELIPTDGLAVEQLETVEQDSRSAFTGVFQNGLDAALANPVVAVFPLNTAGRPLGVAIASRPDAIPAGDSWTFDTSTVPDPGVETFVHLSGSVSP